MNASSLRELQPELVFNDNGLSSARARWSPIAERTVYFGHQLIGGEIVSGINELAREHALPLSVIHAREPATVTSPTFVHFLAGQNGDYASKNACLLRLLESKTRAQRPAVLLKYSPADVDGSVDPSAMFEAYRDTVETIQFEHPDVTVIHATIPLTIVESGLNSLAHQLCGRHTRRKSAILRHEYNQLVRAEFKATEPIFDLAKVESMQPDGSTAGFSTGGTIVETLAAHNTHDGVHLTSQCQRATAAALLDVLSQVVQAAR